jgi:hypothetical protein
MNIVKLGNLLLPIEERPIDWNPIFYCDLDGVNANFASGVELAMGYDPGTFENRKEHGIKMGSIWKVIDNVYKIPYFWRDLPKMPDCDDLWGYINKYNPMILTAPAKNNPRCIPQKKEWCSQNLGVPEDRVICVPKERKKEWAISADGTRNLLIDDFEKNVIQWVESGGIGIIHTSAQSTIEVLKFLGF